ncbi:MAG: hypothetical protein A2945_03240 [Candidatus Liptonbacteria bacterium RIFCSPLOWO2_01_FULL_52_25]|uniref:VTT domain-containing protein n=1 Tax=Candidatus Liptonbacteria bacterium RIFCSPLOWO2_01_FULL_52_25 TaxID=1798650 RepID=A0A1G2CE34_9BACT|nr:MAG: hypothetical protein A2945_03240 [Candidatus Liptonbacteria bacterium RIFCSPLOWO2_01_FULL_52_25]
MFRIIEFFTNFGKELIEQFGYWGIFISMALESAAIPIPSEVVVPLGGASAASGGLNVWAVIFVATAANLAGCVALYYAGVFGGRPLLERYGKYILVRSEDMRKLDGWLARYGSFAAFFSRLLPGVRTFSSIVFGSGNMAVRPFLVYTLIGSFLWNAALAYAGFALGANWGVLQPYFQKFDIVIILLLALGAVFFVKKHLRTTS